jgi:hypothetical protein
VEFSGGKMTQSFRTKEPKNQSPEGEHGNGKNHKIDKDRIRRVKKSFLPSWMRETQDPKTKLS